MTRRKIIAFTGLAGSGKSTAAQWLVERQHYERVRFAGPLKDMMLALGLDRQQVDGSIQAKETPCDLLCGKTPRFAMQTIGTEWGRKLIGEEVWTNAWRAAVDRLPKRVPVVVDDMRYPNEAAAVTALGGFVIRIEREGAGSIVGAAHSSETEVDSIPAIAAIKNDSSLLHLFAKLENLLLDLSWIDVA